ncbi:hypothetical protein B0H66DRAFT_608897 [Apodospora peruviana]|uniref:Bromodomain-containing protein n=1 Tax=Apodospora peruviana TaxID=516989 RepID=A0AAE0HU21_9PEZI|nr:hypothetical protein B0H66DRAFT_608897 [Apodospora peruviana]
MTTQHSEGGLLDEKPIKMDTALDIDGRNGTLEVNGHTSPDKSQSESKSDGVPTHQDKQPAVAEDSVAKQTQIAHEDVQVEDLQPSKGPARHQTDQETVDEAVAATVDDNVLPPADPVAEESAEPTTEPAEPAVAVAAEEDSAPAKEATEPSGDETAARNTSPAKLAEALIPATTESAPDSSALPESMEDVVMADANASAEPASSAEHVVSTQETTMTDAPPVTPGDDSNIQAAGPIAAVDPLQVSPTEQITADTSMSDAPPAVAKVSRERSPDSEGEPIAKRAKLGAIAGEVEVKTGSVPTQDKMDVHSPVNSTKSSLYLENGDPKPLDHESLNPNPITDWQSRQLRNVLALVKKTKAGASFKLPVAQLWPGLWTDYSAKVRDPTDLSTMEKRLRADLPKYANMGEFKADLDRLVQNSILFNGEGHDVTILAQKTRQGVLERMHDLWAVEPAKPDKKEPVKQHPTRHTEPRTSAQQTTPIAAPPKPPKPAAQSPPPKPPVIESPAFAIPANNNGVPLIRRDSTKGDGRAKRPVKPAHSKDLVYDTKRKKKLSPELRFCDEVLTEIRKTKYFDANGPFLLPVDPVALNIPSYHKIIKKPMDLSTMASKMSAGEYVNAKEFERDFDLIVKNCKTFNGEDHTVYAQALRLQSLYKREMARKDEWMVKHAPPTTTTSQATTSPHPRDDSDDEEPESDPEPELEAERKAATQRLAGYMKRLDEENKKIMELMTSDAAEVNELDIAQDFVQHIQKKILAERAKIAAMVPKKAAKPSKPSKPKKSGAATGGAGGGNKKSLPTGTSGAGVPKKASAKKPKRKMGALEKEIIAAGIADLEGPQLERAIDIIKTDTGQGENDSGELELDIEQLSDNALAKLYDIATKSFPELRAQKEKTFAAPPPAETTSHKSKPTASKSKKNKPMSKIEQERRIQQLNDLRAQASRHGSGSQEPMESIEGNGRASADPAPQLNQDSEDEESSEEE